MFLPRLSSPLRCRNSRHLRRRAARATPGKDSDDRGAYPYLGWACDHFQGVKKSPIGNRDYPLTWEQRASQANYDGLKVLDPIYVQQKLSAPHTWHAAEVFLYVLAGSAQPQRTIIPSAPKVP